MGSFPTVSRDTVKWLGRSVGNEHGLSGPSTHEFLFETTFAASDKLSDLISQSGPSISFPDSSIGFGYALVASYEATAVFFNYLGPQFGRWDLNFSVAKCDSYVTTPEYFG